MRAQPRGRMLGLLAVCVDLGGGGAGALRDELHAAVRRAAPEVARTPAPRKAHGARPPRGASPGASLVTSLGPREEGPRLIHWNTRDGHVPQRRSRHVPQPAVHGAVCRHDCRLLQRARTLHPRTHDNKNSTQHQNTRNNKCTHARARAHTHTHTPGPGSTPCGTPSRHAPPPAGRPSPRTRARGVPRRHGRSPAGRVSTSFGTGGHSYYIHERIILLQWT